MADVSLLGVFAVISVAHYYLEKLEHKHFNVHWAVLLLHPTIVSTLRDWAVHMLVYSKYALIAAN